jgi:hypothetical protein
MAIFAAGSVPVSGITSAGLQLCVALWARAVLAHSITAAADSIGETNRAACFSVSISLYSWAARWLPAAARVQE